MLASHNNRVFVGQRIDSTLDAWQMPQGGIDRGESAESAALRELAEETGVSPHLVTIVTRSRHEHLYDIPAHLVGSIWDGRYRGQRQWWFFMRFNGTDSDIDIATEHQEFRAWKWAKPERLPHLIVPFKRVLYETIVAEFAPYF